jgi:lysophospholipase L1-like esterase
MTKFFVFGDSITYGAWDKVGGWVQRLRAFIEEKYPEEHLIYNLGISGDTSDLLLERLEFETKKRIEGKITIFIFQLGLNDSAFLSTKKDFWVSQEKFRCNLREIIKISKKISKKIFFLGITPVDEAKTQPVVWDKRVTYKNENIKKYDEIIKEVCNTERVAFIEIFDKFYKIGYKRLLQDGLHPNSEGHEKIFEIVKDFLIKNSLI